MRDILKIGVINYINLFPIFYMFRKEAYIHAYEFVEGVPSTLNSLLRKGLIDISPSSSIEYLRHSELYSLIDGHSVSSFGPVGSILLFSKKPVNELGGSSVLTSSQSETSAALLDIIFRKFHNIRCPLIPSGESLDEALKSYPAYLLIGDDAMREHKKRQGYSCKNNESELYIYDLGDIWFRETGLPFVFALWIARKDCCEGNPPPLDMFKKNLNSAKDAALRNFAEIARHSPLCDILTEEETVRYWHGISYHLNEEHLKGLDLFRKYAAELNLL